MSAAALQSAALPKARSYAGIVIAAAGFTTIIPALEAVGAIFGLGLIVWPAWLGGVMLRTSPTVGA